jgi:tetratricopeptide (TPR) repeat protein
MRIVAVVLAIALAATLPAYAAKDADLFAAAKIAREQNDHEKAADLLEQAIAINPNVAQYHLMLADAYGQLAVKANMFKMASLAPKIRKELEKTIAIDPRNFEARNGLISYYLQAPSIVGGGADKALLQAAEIKKLDSLRGHRAYARIYLSQKKPDLARAEAVNAVREAPKSGAAHTFLGNLYYNEKNWAAALHEYDMALQIEPTYMPTHYRVGVLANASDVVPPARAEASLKTYLGYKPEPDEPNLISTWYNLGKLYEKLGRKADAKQAYLAAQKLAPGSKEITEALKRLS